MKRNMATFLFAALGVIFTSIAVKSTYYDLMYAYKSTTILATIIDSEVIPMVKSPDRIKITVSFLKPEEMVAAKGYVTVNKDSASAVMSRSPLKLLYISIKPSSLRLPETRTEGLFLFFFPGISSIILSLWSFTRMKDKNNSNKLR